jgi:hypothetical protein
MEKKVYYVVANDRYPFKVTIAENGIISAFAYDETQSIFDWKLDQTLGKELPL